MRKNQGSTSQPISQHPLFPAIVALWCGTLAGLCSIALSPALIERIVVATGIDSVIPMAAPPLGTTTRILLALAMTGIGGVIGALVARRIAAPRREMPQPRRRGAGMVVVPDQAEAIAPAAEPQIQLETPQARTRRRGLTRREDFDFDHDAAAGGQQAAPTDSKPEILDVSAFDLDGFEQSPAREADILTAEAATFEETMPPASSASGAFLSAEPADDINAQETAPDASGFTEDFSARPDTPPFLASGNKLFESYSREMAAKDAPSMPTDPAAPGFQLLPRLHLGNWPELESAEPASPDLVSNASFDVNAGLQPLNGTVAATEPAFQPEAEEVIVSEEVPAAFSVAEFFAEAETEVEHAPQDEAQAWADTEDRPFSQPRTPSRIASSELSELSQVELLERLALAMAQRREQEMAAAAAPQPAPATEPEPASNYPAMADAEAAFAPPQHDVAPRPDEPEAAAMPFGEMPSEEPLEEAAETTSAAPELPPLMAPAAALPEAEAEVTEPEVLPSTPVPAALRPVFLGTEFDSDEEYDDSLPGYIPPRHIALTPAAPQPADFAPIDGDADEFAHEEEEAPHAEVPYLTDEDEAEDDEETRVLEEGYSSLLNLSRQTPPRQQFIRIDEPEATDEIQPVVIFPGEEARQSGPFAAPTPTPPAGLHRLPASQEPAAPSEKRLFDAPSPRSSEETEKALRAALATLQRMSGAA